jgi:starch synthase
MIYSRFRDQAGKQANRDALARENRIDPSGPIIGMVTRIAGQKGFDILLPVLGDIIQLGYRFIILGVGEEVYHVRLREFKKEHRGRISLHLRFDERLAHRIYAGSDFFLMPSRYEPCGLGQMISMRYGTVPIVHRVGGLADTVVQFEPGTGTGFLFDDYSPDALLQAARKARETYARPEIFRALSERCMENDFSWNRSALEYKKLYEQLLAGGAGAA